MRMAVARPTRLSAKGYKLLHNEALDFVARRITVILRHPPLCFSFLAKASNTSVNGYDGGTGRFFILGMAR